MFHERTLGLVWRTTPRYISGSQGIYKYSTDASSSKLSDIQRDLLIGTMLGDANMRRDKITHNPHYRARHGEPQLFYLLHKYEQLKS